MQIGRVYSTEDGGIVIQGWSVDMSDVDADVPALGPIPIGRLLDGQPLDPDEAILGGWAPRELAEVSIQLGEGPTLETCS
jgi:hypothetical protein